MVDATADRLVATRLYLRRWSAERARPTIDGFRLVDEDALSPYSPLVKLFEAVPGARLEIRGAAPSGIVEAAVEVAARTGRTFTLTKRAQADTAGRATLRAPYATGANGPRAGHRLVHR